MAQKKRSVVATKTKTTAVKKTAKQGTSKKPDASPNLTGDALVRQVLQGARLDLKEAGNTDPSEAVANYLLDAERAVAAYQEGLALFAAVPTFKPGLANSAAPLIVHTRAINRKWQQMRFSSKTAPKRANLRENAEKLRSKIIGACRFLFRDQAAKLAEIERIAKGEGLADLIQDMEDLHEVAVAEAALFAMAPKLAGAAEKTLEYAKELKRMKDAVAARELLAFAEPRRRRARRGPQGDSGSGPTTSTGTTLRRSRPSRRLLCLGFVRRVGASVRPRAPQRRRRRPPSPSSRTTRTRSPRECVCRARETTRARPSRSRPHFAAMLERHR
jgi:hypothetical protein